jgi:hypothetical protein
MGNSQSQSVQQTLTAVNSAVTNVTTTTTTTASAISNNINSFTVNVTDSFQCGNPDIPGSGCTLRGGQTINSTQSVTLNASVTNTSQLQQEITSALQSIAENESSSKLGALAIGFNCQDTKQSINQSISNFVTNNITNATTTQISGFVSNANTGILNLSGKWGAGTVFDNPQNIVTTQVVSLIMTALTTNATATAIANSLEATSKSVQSSTIDGIMSALAAMFGTAILGAVLIATAPCIVLICCCYFCCGNKGGKKETVYAPAPAPAAKAATAFGKKLKKDLKQILLK